MHNCWKSGEIGLAKPDPAFFAAALGMAGILGVG